MAVAMKYLRSFPSLRNVFWTLFLLVSLILLWSIYFELDKAIVAEGEVSPKGRPIKVQNAFEGTISETLTQVGEIVDSNDILLRLDTRQENLQLKMLENRLQAVQARAINLFGFLGVSKKHLVDIDTNSNYYKIQKSIASTDLKVLNVKLRALGKQIEANKSKIELLSAKLPLLNKSVQLSERKLLLVSEMQKKGYDGDINLLTAEANFNTEIDKKITLENEIKLAENQIEQLLTEMQMLKEEHRLTYATDAFQAEQELMEIRSEIEKIRVFLSESSIKSPIRGTVSRVLYSNVGQVLEPGTTLIEVIPIDIENVFYVRIPIASISDIVIGQRASITLANLNLRNNSKLEGTLIELDGDVTETDDGRKYYSGLIRFDDPNSPYLIPGVAGSASLQLGKRSVFYYFFDPIIDVLKNSLRE